MPAATIGAPLRIDQPWKAELLAAIGPRLWRKVKLDEIDPLPPIESSWHTRAGSSIDFRFVNFNRVEPDELRQRQAAPGGPADLCYWIYQQLSAHDYGSFDRTLAPLLRREAGFAEVRLVEHLCRSWARLPVGDEPRDLLVLN